MSGYLDNYGAGDEKREKTVGAIVKWAAAALAVALVALFVFYFVIPNRSEKAAAKQFYQLLAARDFRGAYAMWGCTEAKPCRDYPFNTFLQDWGPEAVPVTAVDVLDGESCGSGVIVEADTGKAGVRKLWVERSDRTLGFLPPNVAEVNRCPQGNRIYDFVRDLRYRIHGRKFNK